MLDGWAEAIEASAFASAIRASGWLYPAVETMHVVGVVLLLGAALLLDARLLGVARDLPLERVVPRLSRVAGAGVALAVLSGAALFAADARTVLANPLFLVKLAVIALALVNVAVFHRFTWPGRDSWGARLPVSARAAAAISAVSWMLALVLGQWLAYW